MKELILAAALLSAPVMADWEHRNNVDLMSDSDKSIVFAPASSGDGAAVVRCDGTGSYDVIFMFDYLGDKYESVALRFDQGEPATFSATASTNGKARFLTNTVKADAVAKMAASSRLVVRGIDFRGTPETFVVDLKGFTEQAKKLSCMKGVI